MDKISFFILLISLLNAVHSGSSEQEPDSGPLFMLEPPSNILIQSHLGSMITCSAYGKPAPSLSWIRADGSPLKDVQGLMKIHTNNSLQFLPFQGPLISSIHRASFRCVAANSVGEILSRSVHVKTVKTDDYTEYSVYSQDVWVMIGNTAVFTCDVRPSYVRQYVSVVTWYIDGKVITNDERHYILDRSLHILRVSQLDDGKQIKCVTLNHIQPNLRKESHPATLNVINPVQTSPTIEYKSDTITKNVGENVIIPCVAHGYPLPRNTWIKDGQQISASNLISLAGGDLNLTALKPSDSGIYMCNASNIHGSSVSTTNLIVVEPLSVQITPRTQKIDASLPAKLVCSVSGGPVDQVTWYKDGEELLPGSNIRFLENHTLHLVSVSRRDVGMYQCLVNSVRENAQASSQLQLGLSKPMFHEVFEAQYKYPGSEYSLKCQVYGNPIPVVTWLLAETEVTNSERVKVGSYMTPEGDVVSHVNITDMQVADGGLYACVANNSVGKTSQDLNLNVYGAPLVRAMKNRTVVANQTLSIRCHVSGYPISTITWSKGGEILRRDHRVSMTSDGILTVNPVEVKDKGWYSCAANNSQGLQSTADVYINIITQPVLQPIMFPALTQGDPYAVVCQIKDGDLPIKLSWYKNGQVITAYDFPNLSIKASPPYMSTLTFNSVQTSDVGNFTCVAENLAGSVMSTGILSRVDVEPYWITKPSDASAVLGSSISLQCKGGGSPAPTVTWKKAIDYGSGKYRIIDDSELDKYVVLEIGSLLIKMVDRQDDGYFLCHIDNDVGPGISQAVLVSVNVPATFDERLVYQDTKVGSETSLECEAIGDQPIEITWSYKTLSSRDWKQVTASDSRLQTVSVVTEGGIQSSLTIDPVQRKDTGEYMCTTKNLFGHSIRLIKLTVKEAPASVTQLATTEVSSREVVLFWQLEDDGNSPVTSFYIQYATMQTPWQNVSDGLMTKSNSATIRGMTPATKYKLRVAAENVIGRSSWSTEVVILTDEEPPSSAPLDVKVKPISFNTLFISWKVPPVETWHGSLLGYRVGYKPYNTEQDYQVIILPDQEKTSHTVSNLDTNSSYALIVSAYNSKGAGPISDPVVAVTFENVPSSPPINVRASVLETTIKVMWDKPKLPYLYGKIAGYKAICHSVNKYQDESDQVMITTPDNYATFTDLGIYTNYSIQVLAYTIHGDGMRSYPIYVRTPQIEPNPPEELKCSPINSSSILVSWAEPIPRTGKIQSYQLTVMSGTNVIQDMVITQPDLKTHHIVTELSLNQEYRFIVKAKNIGTPYGQSISATAIISANVEPAFPVIQTLINVAYHDQLLLDCPAVGTEIGKISWTTRSGDPLPSHFLLLSNGSLYVEHVLAEDNGDIKCIAANEYGKAEQIFTLHVLESAQALPSAPELSITAVASSVLQVSWISHGNGGFNLTGWVLEYTNGTQWIPVSILPAERSYWIKGLSCGTKYDIRMRSQNREGSSPYSDAITVQTAGSVPIVTSTDKIIQSVGSTRIALDLTAWSDGGCHISSYSVEIKNLTSKLPGTTSVINAAQTDLLITDLEPASWYSLRIIASNSAGTQSMELQVSTLTSDGYTIAPLKHMKDLQSDENNDMATVLIPVCLLLVVVLLAIAGFAYYVKRRRQAMKYKTRSKSRQSMFSDISEIEPHQGVRRHFNIPRENISGDSRLWLLQSHHSRNPSMITSSESNHALKTEGVYEDCTPTLTYPKSRIAKSAMCSCGHNATRAHCNYCHHANIHLLGDNKALEESMESNKLRQYDSLFADSDFPPPPPEALMCCSVDPGNKRCSSQIEFLHKTGSAVKSRPNTTGVQRADTPGAISKQLSCLGSAMTMSSNHEELLMAYHNSKLYPLSPIQFETPHKLCSSRSLESSDTTEPGIRLFTQSPPKPEETRQAVCEIPIYHCTLPDPEPKYDTDTTTDHEQHCSRHSSQCHKSPQRRPPKKRTKKHRTAPHQGYGGKHRDYLRREERRTNSEPSGTTSSGWSSSASTSDKGYGSRNKHSLLYTTDSSHRTTSRPKSRDVKDEEEKLSLVQTAAQAGETTPPSTQRHLTSGLVHKERVSPMGNPQVIDRFYRSIPDTKLTDPSGEDPYTDEYTIV